MSHAQEVTASSFQEQVLDAKQPVLVDFHADWCGPCRTQGPIVEGLARAYAGRVKVAKLNVDDAPEVSQRYGIRGIPTLLLFRNGEVVERLVGLQPQRRLVSLLDALDENAPQSAPIAHPEDHDLKAGGA